MTTSLKILVPIKRVIDYAVRPRQITKESQVDLRCHAVHSKAKRITYRASALIHPPCGRKICSMC
jgi:hypothetical protein